MSSRRKRAATKSKSGELTLNSGSNEDKAKALLSLMAKYPHFLAALSEVVETGSYEEVAGMLVKISLSTGHPIRVVSSVLLGEFYAHSDQPHSLLRSNCIATKMGSMFCASVGAEYMNVLLGPFIADVIGVMPDDAVEVDPTRLASFGISEDAMGPVVEAHMDNLKSVCQRLLDRVTSPAMVDQMPRTIRAIAGHIAEFAAIFCPEQKLQLVGGFLVLRYLNAALTVPERYGLLGHNESSSKKKSSSSGADSGSKRRGGSRRRTKGGGSGRKAHGSGPMKGNDRAQAVLPTDLKPIQRRKLTLVAKVVQNLSNGVEFGGKEGYLNGMNEWITRSRPIMVKYLEEVVVDPLTKFNGASPWADVATLADPSGLSRSADGADKDLQALLKVVSKHRKEMIEYLEGLVSSASLSSSDQLRLVEDLLQEMDTTRPKKATKLASLSGAVAEVFKDKGQKTTAFEFTAPPRAVGWLKKTEDTRVLGGSRSHKYWFALTEEFLHYFKSPPSPEHKSLPLDDLLFLYNTGPAKEGKSETLRWRVTNSFKTFLLGAKSPRELHMWLTVIQQRLAARFNQSGVGAAFPRTASTASYASDLEEMRKELAKTGPVSRAPTVALTAIPYQVRFLGYEPDALGGPEDVLFSIKVFAFGSSWRVSKTWKEYQELQVALMEAFPNIILPAWPINKGKFGASGEALKTPKAPKMLPLAPSDKGHSAINVHGNNAVIGMTISSQQPGAVTMDMTRNAGESGAAPASTDTSLKGGSSQSFSPSTPSKTPSVAPTKSTSTIVDGPDVGDADIVSLMSDGTGAVMRAYRSPPTVPSVPSNAPTSSMQASRTIMSAGTSASARSGGRGPGKTAGPGGPVDAAGGSAPQPMGIAGLWAMLGFATDSTPYDTMTVEEEDLGRTLPQSVPDLPPGAAPPSSMKRANGWMVDGSGAASTREVAFRTKFLRCFVHEILGCPEVYGSLQMVRFCGLTSVFRAVNHSNLDHVQFLYWHGADLNKANKEGRLPLHLAAVRANTSGGVILDFLARHTKEVDAKDQGGNTPLMLAVRAGLEDRVKTLVKLGANVKAVNSGHITPLHMAAEVGSVPIVKELLKAGAAVDAVDKRGRTPMHRAAAHDRGDAVAALLSAGGNGARVAEDGVPLIVAAAGDGRSGVVKALLGGKTTAANAADRGGRTALHLAAQAGHLECVKLLLKASKIKVDVLAGGTDNPQTPLLLAVKGGHVDIVEALLKKSTSGLGVMDRRGRSALHIAAASGRIDIVRLLVEYGAKVNAVDQTGGRTPLHLAALNRHSAVVEALIVKAHASVTAKDRRGRTVLHDVAMGGLAKCVQFALDAGAKVDDRDNDGSTPVMHAVYSNSLEVVKLLTAAGANVRLVENVHGLTALHVAAGLGYTGIAAALLQSGASVKSATKGGATALHLAARGGQLDTVKLLVSSGSNLECPDDSGCTPLHVAVIRRKDGVAGYLVDQGASVAAKNNDGKTPVDLSKVGGKKTTLTAKLTALGKGGGGSRRKTPGAGRRGSGGSRGSSRRRKGSQRVG